MSPGRQQQMSSYRTPVDDNVRTGFFCSLCCEAFLYVIGPIFFGLYLFEGLGKKPEPAYDCYANNYYDYGVAGVMDIDDPYWINVSEMYRILLGILFGTSLFALLVMVPLRACFGL